MEFGDRGLLPTPVGGGGRRGLASRRSKRPLAGEDCWLGGEGEWRGPLGRGSGIREKKGKDTSSAGPNENANSSLLAEEELGE